MNIITHNDFRNLARNDNYRPDFSIIISVWNDACWLSEFMNSVLSQDYGNFELLIVDDASPDNSYTLLKSFEDKRIFLFQNGNRHYWMNAINELCALSRGRLIKMMCADDLLKPNCLSSFLKFYERHPEVGYMFCNVEKIDNASNIVIPSTRYKFSEIITTEIADEQFIREGCWLSTSSLCIPKVRWDSVGGLRDITSRNKRRLPNCEDFDIAVRLHDKFPAGFISEAIVQSRSHENQLQKTPNAQALFIEADLKIMKYITGRLEIRQFNLKYLLFEKGAAYINLGLGHLLNFRFISGIMVISKVLKTLPIRIVLNIWLKRTTRKLINKSQKIKTLFVKVW